MPEVYMVRPFPMTRHGGNPAPTVLDANGMTSADMKRLAKHFGHECGFIFPSDANSKADYKFRFFVPNHEMEMCGHATIGALWLLREHNRLKQETVFIDTLSGIVEAHVPNAGAISITQPCATMNKLEDKVARDVINILGIKMSDLARQTIINSSTSRVKTLVFLKNSKILHNLKPDFAQMKALNTKIGSTGLYPFCVGEEPNIFHARQFPKSSGYTEDAATGIAATALSFGLLEWGLVEATDHMSIRQGEAMGQPSEIGVHFNLSGDNVIGCWLNGHCKIDEPTLFFQ